MSPPRVVCRPATSPDEVLAAWSLVHDVYVEHGHIEAQPSGLYLAAGALHPDAEVWNAYEGDRLAATITCIADSPLGLPPDDGFREEMATLRGEGRPLAFCGQFVSRPVTAEDSPVVVATRASLSSRLFAVIARRIRDRDPRLRLLSNPTSRHVRYYARFLGFEQVGPIRVYGRYQVESALMVTDWTRLTAAPRLPVELRAALECDTKTPAPPRGVTTASLEHGRMRRYVEAVWGSNASVWAHFGGRR